MASESSLAQLLADTEDLTKPLSTNPLWCTDPNLAPSQANNKPNLVPIQQRDPNNAVVTIAYERGYVESMDYLRGVLEVGETSERALALTKRCVTLNPANYTAWHHRRKCLKTLGKDLQRELVEAQNMAMATPKN